MPDLSRSCEPDCACRCGLSNCACRMFRIPPEWLGQKAAPREDRPLPWEAERPTLWQRIKDGWKL